MEQLRTTDLEAALSFLEEAHAIEGPAPFTPELLGQLAKLVGCEEAAFFEVDQPRRILSERITSGRPHPASDGIPDEVWNLGAQPPQVGERSWACGAVRGLRSPPSLPGRLQPELS